jgi:hypothetical protein
MTDFLTRLAARVLGQTPVLEPVVPSWHTPIDARELAFEEEEKAEASSWLAWRAPSVGRLGETPRAAPALVMGRTEVAAPSTPVVNGGVTVGTPPRRGMGARAESAVLGALLEDVELVPQASDSAARRTAGTRRSQMVANEEPRQEESDSGRVLAAAAKAPAATERAVTGLVAAQAAAAGREAAVAPAVDVERASGVDGPTAARRSSARGRGVLEEAATERREQAGRRLPEPGGSGRQVQPGNTSLDGRRAAQPARRRGPETVQQPPTITVSIGRIEVRAAQPPLQAPAPRAERRKGLSLDEYLAQRNGSRR